jgi:putative heme-binding domain-containing protein
MFQRKLILYRIVVVVTLLCGTAPAAEPDDAGAGLTALAELLVQVDDAEFQLDLLKGMHDALEGRRNVKMPTGWAPAYAKLSKSTNVQVRDKAQSLALIFGDPQAYALVRKTMLDAAAEAGSRRRAIELLVQNNTPQMAPALRALLADKAVRGAALRGLAAYDDAMTPAAILRHYNSLAPVEKTDAVQTLASRPAYATALLDAIEQEKIPSGDVSAFVARQLQGFGDAQLDQRIAKLWGTVRQTTEEKKSLIEEYKKTLTPARLKDADLVNGRLLYRRTCVQCHTLYGEGGKIGPDITGSNRANLDYILENILDPSAAVPRDYRVTNIVTDAGRLISGILGEQTEKTVTIQTVNERIVLDRTGIEQMQPSLVSMMPDGLFDKLTPQEIRDLIAYLATKTPVPLPDERPTAD